jgi:hypothetical protein
MSSMVLGLSADELHDLATFLQALENEKDKYGPELIGGGVRLVGHESSLALEYDRRGDGTYEVFVLRDRPDRDYIVNAVERED